jgi:hypothetical protein
LGRCVRGVPSGCRLPSPFALALAAAAAAGAAARGAVIAAIATRRFKHSLSRTTQHLLPPSPPPLPTNLQSSTHTPKPLCTGCPGWLQLGADLASAPLSPLVGQRWCAGCSGACPGSTLHAPPPPADAGHPRPRGPQSACPLPSMPTRLLVVTAASVFRSVPPPPLLSFPSCFGLPPPPPPLPLIPAPLSCTLARCVSPFSVHGRALLLR